MARELKGHPTTQILKISYTSKEELIKKLELKLEELRRNTQITSHNMQFYAGPNGIFCYPRIL
jgi:hypothetical protein